MTDDQVEHLCARLASGVSFRAACRALPIDEGTARWWLDQPARAEVKALVLAARETGCDALADECVEIADGDGSAADKRVRIDTRLRSGSTAGNILLDANTGEYCTWNSPGVFTHSGFIGGPALSTGLAGIAPGTTTVFGSTNDGNLLVSSYLGATNTELAAAGGFERIFRFGVPIDGGSVTFDNVVLRCQTGNGETGGLIPIAPGYGDPTIAMRISRDGGRSWGNWDEVSLGGQSTNRRKIEWRSLGIIDQPGFLAECRTQNSLYFYVSGALFNEPMNGRDRG